jgi:hypothetical protein
LIESLSILSDWRLPHALSAIRLQKLRLVLDEPDA